jgi:DNA (cytosine-5)-methyltransferase 1
MQVLGGELAWCAETDRHCCKILAVRFEGVPNLGDITAVDWADVPPVDIVTAGWPCQDLSLAGQGAGIKEGTRSGLWFCIAACLRQVRPGAMFPENVAALRTRA